jgi:hypothetical protein
LDANKAALHQAELQANLTTKMENLTAASLDANRAALDLAKEQAKLTTKVRELTEELTKDSYNMKIIAILTALFLPGTFMAVSSPLSS